MAIISDAALLAAVKAGLGIDGDYQDNTLAVYIAEVKGFMLGMGIKPEIVNDDKATGCILRGVSDLWNYGAGDVKLSPYFIQRAIQLKEAEPVSTGEG